METLAYTCRFCHRPGVTEYDPECPALSLAVWQPMLACNRCGSFRLKSAILADRMCAVAGWFAWKGPDKRQAAEEKLTLLTKRWVTLATGHYGRANVWSSELVEQMLERPGHVATLLRVLERMIAKGDHKPAPTPARSAPPEPDDEPLFG